MDKDLDFTGKTILVTGSGRNIGRAIILEFAARGANVVINARLPTATKRKASVRRLRRWALQGDRGHGRGGRQGGRGAACGDDAEAAFGRVDIYVSNGARRLSKDFFDTSDEEWSFYLNQQLTASWYLAKAFAPSMRDAGFGRIIHMSGPDVFSGGWTRVPAFHGEGWFAHSDQVAGERGSASTGITFVNDINPGFTTTVRDPVTHPQFHVPGHAEHGGLGDP